MLGNDNGTFRRTSFCKRLCARIGRIDRFENEQLLPDNARFQSLQYLFLGNHYWYSVEVTFLTNILGKFAVFHPA